MSVVDTKTNHNSKHKKGQGQVCCVSFKNLFFVQLSYMSVQTNTLYLTGLFYYWYMMYIYTAYIYIIYYIIMHIIIVIYNIY